MPELNRRHRHAALGDNWASAHKAEPDYPSVEQLMAEQGTGPIIDVSVLHGDFWPEEESSVEFLETLHTWRGHKRISHA
jgi:hypothetical protein